jgi:hypothetical protein
MNVGKPFNDIEIIDPKTDKIIGKLSIPASKMMVVVKPGKIYASYGKNNYPPPYQKPGLLVLDTKTDQIIKRFDGIYSGISEKSFVQ